MIGSWVGARALLMFVKTTVYFGFCFRFFSARGSRLDVAPGCRALILETIAGLLEPIFPVRKVIPESLAQPWLSSLQI